MFPELRLHHQKWTESQSVTIGAAGGVLQNAAAEMIAVNSGLGFLIVDARNAGNTNKNALKMAARPRLDPMIFMNPPMIWFSLS